jgi:signal transduction histidine kinase
MKAAAGCASVIDVLRRFLSTYGELVFVFVLGVLAQVELWLDSEWAEDRRSLAPLAFAMAATLLLRIRWPLLTLVLLLVAFEGEGALITAQGNDPMAMVLILLVGIYSAGAHAQGRSLAAATALVAVAIPLAMLEDGSSLNVSGFLFFLFFLGGPYVAGIVIRIRREREHLLVGEREERARAAVAEERTRIARELHDVVAHAISVIVLQARGARHALEREPSDAREAIDAIEETAEAALGEMRRLLGVLRARDELIALAPQPSVGQLPALLAHVRGAGLPVELSIEGEPVELAPGVDLSAYRIVQEALTNTLKHAGPASARVTVRYEPGSLLVEVADDGAGTANGNGGHGLVGMRERVSVFGGDLESGPGREGGFAVRARLPL